MGQRKLKVMMDYQERAEKLQRFKTATQPQGESVAIDGAKTQTIEAPRIKRNIPDPAPAPEPGIVHDTNRH